MNKQIKDNWLLIIGGILIAIGFLPLTSFMITNVSATTLGTVKFRESSPVLVGTTIHADFTWTNAEYDYIKGSYATMYIKCFNVYDLDGDGDVIICYNGHAASGSKTLTCTVDKEGIWIANISIWNGREYITYSTDVDYIIASTATGTANCWEETIEIGDTIHASFTWSHAKFNKEEQYYAIMAISDSDENSRIYYTEKFNGFGSKTLSYRTEKNTIDKPGNWTAQIVIWSGNIWTGYTDTIQVKNTKSSENNGGDGSTPGFEFTFLIIVIASIILLKRRNKRNQ